MSDTQDLTGPQAMKKCDVCEMIFDPATRTEMFFQRRNCLKSLVCLGPNLPNKSYSRDNRLNILDSSH